MSENKDYLKEIDTDRSDLRVWYLGDKPYPVVDDININNTEDNTNQGDKQ